MYAHTDLLHLSVNKGKSNYKVHPFIEAILSQNSDCPSGLSLYIDILQGAKTSLSAHAAVIGHSSFHKEFYK